MKARISFFSLLFLVLSTALWAEYEPRLWLNSKAGAAYEQVASELQGIFDQAEGRQIPGDLLVDKLNEGAAKRVTGAQLVQALRAEVERLTQAIQMLEKREKIASASRASLLKALSLLLQGGVSVDTIDAVLEYANLVQKPTNRAVDALSASFRIIAIAQAPANLLRPLSECLIRSSLKETQFAQLQSLAVRAKGRNIMGEPLVKLIIGSLDSGSGLAALDRELQTRSQRP
ncbi:hypothetical protein [Gracilinema caldarium]|jgi:hypothetical protein|uniref:hypothetical protein n=1 Tax=Gracilinema caldarium TaxID=215591 RepID=UPI0016BAE04A|nr:hypothetical protein [Gracilinema caldarium]NLJ09386.1 hypothetical protein [Treponema sp.]